MIGVINLRYFILIIGHIDIHPILELLTNLISPAHWKFKASILYRTSILILSSETGSRIGTHFH